MKEKSFIWRANFPFFYRACCVRRVRIVYVHILATTFLRPFFNPEKSSRLYVKYAVAKKKLFLNA